MLLRFVVLFAFCLVFFCFVVHIHCFVLFCFWFVFCFVFFCFFLFCFFGLTSSYPLLVCMPHSLTFVFVSFSGVSCCFVLFFGWDALSISLCAVGLFLAVQLVCSS